MNISMAIVGFACCYLLLTYFYRSVDLPTLYLPIVIILMLLDSTSSSFIILLKINFFYMNKKLSDLNIKDEIRR